MGSDGISTAIVKRYVCGYIFTFLSLSMLTSDAACRKGFLSSWSINLEPLPPGRNKRAVPAEPIVPLDPLLLPSTRSETEKLRGKPNADDSRAHSLIRSVSSSGSRPPGPPGVKSPWFGVIGIKKNR